MTMIKVIYIYIYVCGFVIWVTHSRREVGSKQALELDAFKETVHSLALCFPLPLSLSLSLSPLQHEIITNKLCL